MHRALRIFIAAMSISPAAFAAPDDIKVCEVIPVGDVEAATGLKLSVQRAGYRTCTWRTATPTMWVDAKAFKRAGHTTNGTASVEQMKKMGFKGEVTDDTPDLWCSRLQAPPAMGGSLVVDCHALTKGHYFEAQMNGPDATLQKTKALIAKMAARLP